MSSSKIQDSPSVTFGLEKLNGKRKWDLNKPAFPLCKQYSQAALDLCWSFEALGFSRSWRNCGNFSLFLSSLAWETNIRNKYYINTREDPVPGGYALENSFLWQLFFNFFYSQILEDKQIEMHTYLNCKVILTAKDAVKIHHLCK